MTKIDTNILREIIESEVESQKEQMFYKDTFATGCYLHKLGKKGAGRKLCYGVLYSLGYGKRKNYFAQILDTLEGNEELYAVCLWAHHEINELFRMPQDGL